jgi:thiol-disulfide isomerase/thioredoxin
VTLDQRVFRPLAIGVTLALVGFIAYAVVSANHPGTGTFPSVPAPSTLHPGERAPSFDLPRLGGGAAFAFPGHAAEPVVLNFFASWCPNCVAELHAFGSVSSAAGSIRFFGVDSEDPAVATAEELLHRAGISYPVGVDRSGSVANRYLIAALPVTFFIAPTGAVQGEIFGAATASQLRTWVARLSRSAQ